VAEGKRKDHTAEWMTEEPDEFEDLQFDDSHLEEDEEDEGNEEHLDLFCRNERLDVNDLSTKRALAFSVADAVKTGASAWIPLSVASNSSL
jgi:hypothetical protein